MLLCRFDSGPLSNRCCRRRRPPSRRRRRLGGESSQPSIARVVSTEAFKDDNYARVQSQLGVFLQMRSLPTAATGREMVLMTAAHGGPVRKPRSKPEGQGDGGGCLDPFLDTACESLAVFEMKKLLVFR